jgi:hypothetical protein
MIFRLILELSKHFIIKDEIPLGTLSLVSYTLSKGALTFVTLISQGPNAFTTQVRTISTSSTLSSGLSSNLITPRKSPIEGLVFKPGEPLPQASKLYYPMNLSIHSSTFFIQLWNLIRALLSTSPEACFSLLVAIFVLVNIIEASTPTTYNTPSSAPSSPATPAAPSDVSTLSSNDSSPLH